MTPPGTSNFNLAAFVARTEQLGPAGQREAIRAEITAQGGRVDLPPDTADGYHLALFGLQSVGISEDDAIRHWLCTARTLLGGWPIPSDDPALRVPQIVWAMHILSDWLRTPAHHLHAACQIVLRLSSNPILRQRAIDLARTYGFPTELPTA